MPTAAALVEVDYDPLPGVSDAVAALEPGSPLAREELESNECFVVERRGGDVEQAFREASRVVSLSLNNPRLASVTLEPRVILAVPDPSGEGLTIWLATQAPFRQRADLASVLGLPENHVRVIAPDVGGAFGTKNGVYREDVLACLFAVRLGRPVKWTSTRSQDFLTMHQGRGVHIEADLALDEDGTMRGLRVRAAANLGAYLQGGTAGPPGRLLAMAPGAVG